MWITTGNNPKIVPQPWIKEILQINDLKHDEDPPLQIDIRSLMHALNSSYRATMEDIFG
jgi:hypothetical protein